MVVTHWDWPNLKKEKLENCIYSWSSGVWFLYRLKLECLCFDLMPETSKLNIHSKRYNFLNFRKSIENNNENSLYPGPVFRILTDPKNKSGIAKQKS